MIVAATHVSNLDATPESAPTAGLTCEAPAHHAAALAAGSSYANARRLENAPRSRR
jgi:hypothetical protein